MHLIVNGRKIDNPVAVIFMVLVALSLVGAVVALVLFVLLPIVGIFITGVLALIVVILTPIILWFVLPMLFIAIIGCIFGKLLK